MKPTVKILLVLLAALTAQTVAAQDNACPLGGIIYQHGNIILRDRDGDISEQQAQGFRARGLRFRVDPAFLAGPHGETGRYRTVTIKVVFESPGNASWVHEYAIPHETNGVAYVGIETARYVLRNLGDGYFRLSPAQGRGVVLAAPRIIYTGDVCFYQVKQPQR